MKMLMLVLLALLPEAAVRPDDPVPLDEQVRRLGDASNEIRAQAAAAIRQALARHPAAIPNCHDRAYWERKVQPLKAGTPLKEALRILFPDLTDEQREKAMEGGFWSGQSGARFYRLDDYWQARFSLRDAENEKLIEPPTLARSVRYAWVEPPAGYTGVWVTWFVNGQKAHEIEYANGVYHGTFTSFRDDGTRSVVQHYVKGVCHGADTGYHPSGRKAYEGMYDNDKQVGTWRWFSEAGEVTSVQEHGKGEEPADPPK